jgi:hypothetical protein
MLNLGKNKDFLMRILRKNEAGFSAVEAVLVLVIVALIGVVGYLVYQKQTAKTPTGVDKTTKSTASTESVTDTKPMNQADLFINVIEADNVATQKRPEDIAKTTNQAAVLRALHDTCSGDSTFITVSYQVFSERYLYVEDADHAYIVASKCTPIVTGVAHLDGGSRFYLHKGTSGKWTYDFGGQMAPDCTLVDGLGYPITVLESCYDGSTARAPR